MEGRIEVGEVKERQERRLGSIIKEFSHRRGRLVGWCSIELVLVCAISLEDKCVEGIKDQRDSSCQCAWC